MQSTIAKFNQQLQSAKCKIQNTKYNHQFQNSISTCKVQNAIAKCKIWSAISNCKIQYDEGSFPADYLEDLVTSMEGTNGFGFKHSWGNLRRMYTVVSWSSCFWRWWVVMMKIKTMIIMMMLMYWWCYDDDDVVMWWWWWWCCIDSMLMMISLWAALFPLFQLPALFRAVIQNP